MAGSNFQLSSSSACEAYELPSDFKFLKLLGEGSFGKVLKCLKKDTKQTVAVKIPMCLEEDSTEVSTMEKLMLLNLHQHNIVQFLGWFHTSCGKAMVFESLDISLEDFILQRNCAPMLLRDIRTIIQQLATALHALKSIGLIHMDLKPDNIMMVDHQRRPFGVKLIDFGLAMHRSKAQQGTTFQVVYYRAPEIMLGLPFSEAIDMWSLGCVMAEMLQGNELFQGDTEYEALHDIIALLGVPADHLLKNGLKTDKYFTKTCCNHWRLKTHQEFWRKYSSSQQKYKTDVHHCLHDLRRLRLEKENKLEDVQRAWCIDLLEAMLSLDADKRITPIKILTHPFITSRKHSSNIKKNRRTTHDATELPPGVILVRPAAAKNRRLQDRAGGILERPAASKNRGLQDRAGGILDCPSDAVNMVLLDIDEEISEEPTAALKEDIQTDRSSPSPTAVPPGVILVRPAAAEHTLQLEDKDRAARMPAWLNKTYSVKVMNRDTTGRTHDVARTEKKTEQKKKNCVRHLFSWMKKTFGSCCVAVDIDHDDIDHDDKGNNCGGF